MNARLLPSVRRLRLISFLVGACVWCGHSFVVGIVLTPVGTLGTALGLTISFMAGRVLASQLREVKLHDPLTLVMVVSVVGITGLLACWLPARRATKVVRSWHYAANDQLDVVFN